MKYPVFSRIILAAPETARAAFDDPADIAFIKIGVDQFSVIAVDGSRLRVDGIISVDRIGICDADSVEGRRNAIVFTLFFQQLKFPLPVFEFQARFLHLFLRDGDIQFAETAVQYIHIIGITLNLCFGVLHACVFPAGRAPRRFYCGKDGCKHSIHVPAAADALSPPSVSIEDSGNPKEGDQGVSNPAPAF